MSTLLTANRAQTFEVEVVFDNGEEARVRIRGALTHRFEIRGEDPLAAALGFGAYGRSVLLDVGEVTLFGTCGLSWLLSANKKMEKCGGRMVLHSLPPCVRNLIRVLRVESNLTIAENETAAEGILAGEKT